MAGDASPQLRWYAARHGIVLVERTRWPAPVLGDPLLRWPPGDGPDEIDRQRLACLSRPLRSIPNSRTVGWSFPAAFPMPPSTRCSRSMTAGRITCGSCSTRVTATSTRTPSARPHDQPLPALRGHARPLGRCDRLPLLQRSRGRSIADRAIAVLEHTDVPLAWWDVKRALDREPRSTVRPPTASQVLADDLRACWGGRGIYGLYTPRPAARRARPRTRCGRLHSRRRPTAQPRRDPLHPAPRRLPLLRGLARARPVAGHRPGTLSRRASLELFG